MTQQQILCNMITQTIATSVGTIAPELAARLESIGTIASKKGYTLSSWEVGFITYFCIHKGVREANFMARDRDYDIAWVAVRLDSPANIKSGLDILEGAVNDAPTLTIADKISIAIQRSELAPRGVPTQHRGRSID